ARYEVSCSFYGHLGSYHCPSCGLSRPWPEVVATACNFHGDEGTEIRVDTPLGPFSACLHLPGLYNVYNALAASAVALALGLTPAAVARHLDTFSAAFGRLERIAVEQRQLFLALVKNPVGFTEVLRTIVPTDSRRTLLIAINDLFADGTDVSWLWDVEFERLVDRVNVAVCTGLRAADMAV